MLRYAASQRFAATCALLCGLNGSQTHTRTALAPVFALRCSSQVAWFASVLHAASRLECSRKRKPGLTQGKNTQVFTLTQQISATIDPH